MRTLSLLMPVFSGLGVFAQIVWEHGYITNDRCDVNGPIPGYLSCAWTLIGTGTFLTSAPVVVQTLPLNGPTPAQLFYRLSAPNGSFPGMYSIGADEPNVVQGLLVSSSASGGLDPGYPFLQTGTHGALAAGFYFFPLPDGTSSLIAPAGPNNQPQKANVLDGSVLDDGYYPVVLASVSGRPEQLWTWNPYPYPSPSTSDTGTYSSPSASSTYASTAYTASSSSAYSPPSSSNV